ncbi:hypothetical protein K5N30_002762 [Vibrio parahaemolyticus]|nr:hypothetical protein [Vibrio parahaemolyticus]
MSIFDGQPDMSKMYPFTINHEKTEQLIELAKTHLDDVEEEISNITSQIDGYEREKESISALVKYIEACEKRQELLGRDNHSYLPESGLNDVYRDKEHAQTKLLEVERALESNYSRKKLREEQKAFLENDISLLESISKTIYAPSGMTFHGGLING